MQMDKVSLLKNTLKAAGVLATTALAGPALAWEECGQKEFRDSWCLDECTKQENYERQCYSCEYDNDLQYVACVPSYTETVSDVCCAGFCGGGGYCGCGGGGGGGQGCPWWWPPCWFS